eukprot:Em0024g39a
MSLQDNHKKLIVAITRELQGYVACLEKQRVRLGQHQGLQHSIWQFYLLYNDLSPRVLVFIKNSFQGVVPAMSCKTTQEADSGHHRVLQGKQRPKDAVDAEVKI